MHARSLIEARIFFDAYFLPFMIPTLPRDVIWKIRELRALRPSALSHGLQLNTGLRSTKTRGPSQQSDDVICVASAPELEMQSVL